MTINPIDTAHLDQHGRDGVQIYFDRMSLDQAFYAFVAATDPYSIATAYRIAVDMDCPALLTARRSYLDARNAMDATAKTITHELDEFWGGSADTETVYDDNARRSCDDAERVVNGLVSSLKRAHEARQ